MNDQNIPRKAVAQNGRSSCYFCGSEGPLETHHVVPQRFNGPDSNKNLVDLCPTCHQRLERLYDNDMWHMIKQKDFETNGSENDEEGTSKSELKRAKEDIKIAFKKNDGELRISVLKENLRGGNHSPDLVERGLKKLRQEGELYEPETGVLRIT